MHKKQAEKVLQYYNVMIDGKNFFDQPVNKNKITYEKIRKIATGCLLDYPYFKENYKMVAGIRCWS